MSRTGKGRASKDFHAGLADILFVSSIGLGIFLYLDSLIFHTISADYNFYGYNLTIFNVELHHSVVGAFFIWAGFSKYLAVKWSIVLLIALFLPIWLLQYGGLQLLQRP